MGSLLWGEDYRFVEDPRTKERRTLDRSMTEKAWQAEVMAEARRLHWRFIYHQRKAMVGKPPRWITNTIMPEGLGFPDLTLLRAPHLVVLELKTEAKAPEPAQVEWLTEWAQLSCCVALWARPRDRALVYDVLAAPWRYLEETPKP